MKLIKKLTAILLAGTMLGSLCSVAFADISTETGFYTYEVKVIPDTDVENNGQVKIELWVKSTNSQDIVIPVNGNSLFNYSLKLPAGIFNIPSTLTKNTDYTSTFPSPTVTVNKAAAQDTITFAVNGSAMQTVEDMYQSMMGMPGMGQVKISNSAAYYSLTLSLSDNAKAGETYTIDFQKDNCGMTDGSTGSMTLPSKINFVTDSFTMASSGETGKVTTIDADKQTVGKQDDESVKTYESTDGTQKYLKHIATVLDGAAANKTVTINKVDAQGNVLDSKVSGRTLAQIFYGVTTENTTISGNLAIGVLTSNVDDIFEFVLVDAE